MDTSPNKNLAIYELLGISTLDSRLCGAADHLVFAHSEKPEQDMGFGVAHILRKLKVDETTLTATLLSAPALEGRLSDEQISQEFGAEISALVKSVRWLNSFNDSERQSKEGPLQAERVRRMVLAMVDDVRAVIIKLGYRLQRLKGLPKESYELRRAIAKETLDIYTPLANRLGLAQIKWEMEDYAFRYLEPQAYKQLAKALEEKRQQREAYVAEFVAKLHQELNKLNLKNYEVHGRPKHIYSIWKKMQRKQLQFSDLFDIRAVRVVVSSVSECYLALGAVHALWQHVPLEFDDYIANPKGNGYQSLHTAVVGPEGKVVEVQIRTRDMHQLAELGVAAHWHYKEGGSKDTKLEASVRELRNLLESGGDDEALVESFRAELYTDRVFVFTPRGQVMDLPRGATAVDFAYQVHTEVGHRCRGAKVNGHIVNLRTPLENGDHVEILTAKQGKPRRDWLNKDLGFLVSANARAKVRGWFNQQDHHKHLEEGKDILEKELRRLNRSSVNLEKLTRQLHFDKHSELYIALGRNEITHAQIASAVEALEKPGIPSKKKPTKVPAKASDKVSDVAVLGVGNLMTQMARCCKPVPYDEIMGYITKGSGVSVHRSDCHNILVLGGKSPERLIDVSWGEDASGRYHTGIRILAFARERLLSDLANLVSDEGAELTGVNTEKHKRDNTITIQIKVEVADIDQLSRIMGKIAQLGSVRDVTREG